MRPSPLSPHLSHHRVDSYRHCSPLWSATHTSQHVTFYLCTSGNRVRASQGALVVKNPCANAGDRRDSGSIPGWGRRLGFNPWVGKVPWRRAWQPTPVCLPGESHGQKSLVGYSPQGHTESDTPEATQHACEQSFLFSFTPAQDTHSACHNSILTVQSDSLKAPYYFHKFSLLGGSL